MNQHWTPEADAELAELYKTMSAGAIGKLMGRTRCSIKGRVNVLGLKKPEGLTNTGRFMAGHATWNKGKQFDSGGRSHETRFQPGHRGGRAIELYHPVGSERITKDGYIQRKISDDPVFYKRWKFVHIIVWEGAHGPVPKGHAVVFKNKDRTDTRLENLELISRAELMQRNTVHNYPEDLRQVIRLKGAITKRIATRTRKEQQP